MSDKSTHSPPYFIYETASFHGGDPDTLKEVSTVLGKLDYPHQAIKFHPIGASALAREDFFVFNLYKELEITDENWKDMEV